uniref:Uncharacterized protein LOC104245777 n=1 Tax=Nicotiana sylvestris TaxID=4096 RepID=A0A1U7Y6I5_NICSY|nr:PREDICTED: uncharacterized protein LOC104245777 [Nicotiana sylvestris]
MADRTMKRLLGIIDDMLVCVDKFILLGYFVILDCEVEYEVPIILGMTFLEMGKALVDVEVGELTFRVDDEKVVCLCVSLRGNPIAIRCALVGAVLGKSINKIYHPIYYASMTMNSAQVNCTVTAKELLAIVFAIEKLRPYLIGAKVIVHTDHAALRYLIRKKDFKSRLMRWVILLQEFDIDIQDRKGNENQVANHLSHLEEEGRPHDGPEINDSFPDEKRFANSMN